MDLAHMSNIYIKMEKRCVLAFSMAIIKLPIHRYFEVQCVCRSALHNEADLGKNEEKEGKRKRRKVSHTSYRIRVKTYCWGGYHIMSVLRRQLSSFKQSLHILNILTCASPGIILCHGFSVKEVTSSARSELRRKAFPSAKRGK